MQVWCKSDPSTPYITFLPRRICKPYVPKVAGVGRVANHKDMLHLAPWSTRNRQFLIISPAYEKILCLERRTREERCGQVLVFPFSVAKSRGPRLVLLAAISSPSIPYPLPYFDINLDWSHKINCFARVLIAGALWTECTLQLQWLDGSARLAGHNWRRRNCCWSQLFPIPIKCLVTMIKCTAKFCKFCLQ